MLELLNKGIVLKNALQMRSSGSEGSMYAQRVLISSLATYKQWKLDNGLGNKNLYKDNREAFGKAHPTVTKILDQTPESKR